MSLMYRIAEAKRRAEEAIRTHDLSGRENAGLMADVALDAALPVLLGPPVATPSASTTVPAQADRVIDYAAGGLAAAEGQLERKGCWCPGAGDEECTLCIVRDVLKTLRSRLLPGERLEPLSRQSRGDDA